MDTLVAGAYDGDDEEGTDSVNPESVVDNTLDDGDLIQRPDPKVFVPSVSHPLPTFRCTQIKKDGERCEAYGTMGMQPQNAKCLFHGGRQLSVKEKAAARVDAARMKILEDTGLAAETLEQLMQVGTADNIRLKAATEILDRAGIRGGIEIDMGVEVVHNSAQEVRDRLKKLLAPDEEDEDIVDAEVVEDGNE